MHRAWLFFMQEPGRSPESGFRCFSARLDRSRANFGEARHETDDRDHRRRLAVVLPERVERRLCRQRRWPELFIQHRQGCISSRALRRDPQAMRRKILGELLQRQAVVGGLNRSGESATTGADAPKCVVPAKAGTHNHRPQMRHDRSLQSGLSCSISRIFQSRRQFFNCFSRVIASRDEAKHST